MAPLENSQYDKDIKHQTLETELPLCALDIKYYKVVCYIIRCRKSMQPMDMNQHYKVTKSYQRGFIS